MIPVFVTSHWRE